MYLQVVNLSGELVSIKTISGKHTHHTSAASTQHIHKLESCSKISRVLEIKDSIEFCILRISSVNYLFVRIL